MNRKCENCYFYEKIDAEDYMSGECRRHPPKMFNVAIDEVTLRTRFPEVYAEWWCGEWVGIAKDGSRPKELGPELNVRPSSGVNPFEQIADGLKTLKM